MLQLLVVALLASGVVAEDVEPAKAARAAVPAEAEAAESVPVAVTKDGESAEQNIPMASMLRGSPDQFDSEDYRNDHLYLKAKLDGHRPEGPAIARTLHSSLGHGPNIAEQDEIIKFTYSPAYYEPIWVLDYRFLKSGGRRYTRGPGGQILILPRSYKHYKGDDTHDYDTMIEHLRLKLIAEQSQRMREHGFAHQHDNGHYEQPINHRESEPINYREREPVHSNEHEPIFNYGPMKPMRMEMGRERMQMERERETARMGMGKIGREHRMYH